MTTIADLERLMAFVELDDDECWIFTGGERRTYGAFWLNGKTIPAHKASYIIHYGEFDDSLQVLHHCDKRLCVKPPCLFLGTHKQNMADMVAKDRQAKGSSNANAKLTEEMVIVIRELVASGYTQVSVAKAFYVRKTTINAIVHGRNWSWLE